MSATKFLLYALHVLAAIALAAYWFNGWRGVAVALIGLAALIALLLSFVLVRMAHIARGESDVNGDPERDAGLPWPPDDDLHSSSHVWDHGSARTAGATVLSPSGRPGFHGTTLTPTTSND